MARSMIILRLGCGISICLTLSIKDSIDIMMSPELFWMIDLSLKEISPYAMDFLGSNLRPIWVENSSIYLMDPAIRRSSVILAMKSLILSCWSRLKNSWPAPKTLANPEEVSSHYLNTLDSVIPYDSFFTNHSTLRGMLSSMGSGCTYISRVIRPLCIYKPFMYTQSSRKLRMVAILWSNLTVLPWEIVSRKRYIRR